MTDPSLDLKYSPHFIKAALSVADLLVDLDAFEALGCAFAVITNAYVRAKLKNPHVQEFELRGVTFQTDGLRERLIILSHVAKPSAENPSVPTLRPFAELLVTHGLAQARLISPNTWTAWVEVRAEGKPWRRLRQTEKPPVQPAPTTVLDAPIPPAPEAADV